MDKNPFAPAFDALPLSLPIFPLEGVLLLPHGALPLNVFEPRYMAMVNDALAGDRLIGMVQPDQAAREAGEDGAIYQMGCAGKITEFSEMDDGRYLVSLTGIARFRIAEELDQEKGYRRVKPDWSDFESDLETTSCLGMDRGKVNGLLKKYFDEQGMDCDWDAVQSAPDGKLITCLAMACPLEPQEKQALLEATCCKTRADMFVRILEMAVCDAGGCDSKH